MGAGRDEPGGEGRGNMTMPWQGGVGRGGGTAFTFEAIGEQRKEHARARAQKDSCDSRAQVSCFLFMARFVFAESSGKL